MTKFIIKNKSGILLLVVGMIFISIGIIRAEIKTVLMKAIAICLECIGIG